MIILKDIFFNTSSTVLKLQPYIPTDGFFVWYNSLSTNIDGEFHGHKNDTVWRVLP